MRGDVDYYKPLSDDVAKVARAITSDAAAGTDQAGGSVGCLTEAVMGMTAGLMAIASALERIADSLDHDL